MSLDVNSVQKKLGTLLEVLLVKGNFIIFRTRGGLFHVSHMHDDFWICCSRLIREKSVPSVHPWNTCVYDCNNVYPEEISAYAKLIQYSLGNQ